MCAYVNHSTNKLFDDTQNNPFYREIAVEKSQSYAQDAILLAMIALEEAELATLEAILNKVEADQLATKE